MTQEQYGLAYQEGFKSTMRFLVSRGAQIEFAIEAAQAGWARGWERRDQLRDEARLQSWVNTIALNIYRRVPRLESLIGLGLDLAHSPTSGFAAIEAGRILDSCGPTDRFLLEQQMQGATTIEMAEILGLTDTAIRIRLMRARRSVRARLERKAAHLRRACARPTQMERNAA